MKICTKCGTQCSDIASRCPKCKGVFSPQVNANNPVAATTCLRCGNTYVGQFCNNCGATKKRKKGCLFAIIIAVLVALSVAFIQSISPNTKTVGGASVNGEPQNSSTPTTSSAPPQDSGVTTGQKNALKKAKTYLAVSGFSYNGLIAQLEFEGFSKEESEYGAKNCEADWNEQAARKAKAYLNVSAFSRKGLIDQLIFDGFTKEQAAHGADANGY